MIIVIDDRGVIQSTGSPDSITIDVPVIFNNSSSFSYGSTNIVSGTFANPTLSNTIFSGSTYVNANIMSTSFTASIGQTRYYLSCSTPITCTLPSGIPNQTFEFWDVSGSLATFPCLIVPSGSQAINYQSSYIFNRNFGGQSIVFFSSSVTSSWIAGS